LLEDRDKNVREETKSLAVEIYRWIKDAIKPQLTGLKAVQLQELETAFEKEKDERATPIRYLRSQQDRQNIESVEDTAGSAAPAAAQEEDTTVDPFDLLDPVDIISKLPNDFYELCEAKKWQERKEALETLQKLIDENPKLATGDYAELVKQLKKFIGKDNNVVVVAAAAKCLAGIAKGLRKSFYPYSHSCISTILEKFKEKKANVVTGLREAIDAIIVSVSLS
jgi:cytoskeleton-associated protein 5